MIKQMFKKINHSLNVGLSFGLTSGVITTLGLMIGLNASTHSKMTVIGGILTIAVADSFSDALGIHLSEESEGRHTGREIWLSTVSTFLFKLIFTLSFLVPVIFLKLPLAVLAALGWGFLLLAVFSLIMAKKQGKDTWKMMLEHTLVAMLVVILSYFIGDWVATSFV